LFPKNGGNGFGGVTALEQGGERVCDQIHARLLAVVTERFIKDHLHL
jgi:hypothetical protein